MSFINVGHTYKKMHNSLFQNLRETDCAFGLINGPCENNYCVGFIKISVELSSTEPVGVSTLRKVCISGLFVLNIANKHNMIQDLLNHSLEGVHDEPAQTNSTGLQSTPSRLIKPL